jgi:hypothetical protein
VPSGGTLNGQIPPKIDHDAVGILLDPAAVGFRPLPRRARWKGISPSILNGFANDANSVLADSLPTSCSEVIEVLGPVVNRHLRPQESRRWRVPTGEQRLLSRLRAIIKATSISRDMGRQAFGLLSVRNTLRSESIKFSGVPLGQILASLESTRASLSESLSAAQKKRSMAAFVGRSCSENKRHQAQLAREIRGNSSGTELAWIWTKDKPPTFLAEARAVRREVEKQASARMQKSHKANVKAALRWLRRAHRASGLPSSTMRQIDPITGKGLRGILDSLRDASPGPSDQGRPIYRVLSGASMEIIAAALWSSFLRRSIWRPTQQECPARVASRAQPA